MAPPLLPNGAEAAFKTDLANTIFYWIGLSATLLFFARVVTFFRLYTRSSTLSRYHHSAPGSTDSPSSAPWAIVTGSSDGIGFGFAKELAKERFNVILHGRNPAKLQSKIEELTKEFPGVQFKFIVGDASASTASGRSGIEEAVKELQGLRITVMINNIGGVEPIMFPSSRTLEKTSVAEVDGLINLNARFPTQLTKALWPILTAHKGPTLITNIGSLGESGMPYVAVYSGAKSFNMAWSRAMRIEVQAEKLDIEVLGVLVGVVTGVTHKKSKPTLFEPTARKMAEAALAKVGCGRDVVIGYLPHALQIAVMAFVPDRIYTTMITNIMQASIVEQNKRV